ADNPPKPLRDGALYCVPCVARCKAGKQADAPAQAITIEPRVTQVGIAMMPVCWDDFVNQPEPDPQTPEEIYAEQAANLARMWDEANPGVPPPQVDAG